MLVGKGRFHASSQPRNFDVVFGVGRKSYKLRPAVV
jgi:hypothetical protein